MTGYCTFQHLCQLFFLQKPDFCNRTFGDLLKTLELHVFQHFYLNDIPLIDTLCVVFFAL